jgi:peptidyl-prolyl cis-trans isomerase A (cyclophilin A)
MRNKVLCVPLNHQLVNVHRLAHRPHFPFQWSLMPLDFVIQFGIASDPNETSKWNHEIRDDPVIRSNVQGTVTFATAGEDTRTTQLFINLRDNSRLDNSGFAPIGKVVSGMDTLASIVDPTPNSGGNGVDQETYEQKGNAWILSEYPQIDLIDSTTVILNDTIPPHSNSTDKHPTAPKTSGKFSSSTIPWMIVALVFLPLWTLAMFLREVDDRRLRQERSDRMAAAAASERQRSLPQVT